MGPAPKLAPAFRPETDNVPSPENSEPRDPDALREALEVATLAAETAGECLLSHFDALDEADIGFKGQRDLVTRADRDAESLIVERLRAHFPQDAIWAEEGGKVAEGSHQWIIDPLDGTTNFVHSLPIFGVSIARVDPSGEPELGVVLVPRLGELYTAGRGLGARRNGVPIHVSTRTELKNSLLATGFHYERQTRDDSNVGSFNKFVLHVRGIRRMGAASVDLAYVAAGRLDGYWEPHLSPWDVAAGALLVREAGGRVTDMVGGNDWLHGAHIVASNGTDLHGRILDVLATPLPGWADMQRRIGGA